MLKDLSFRIQALTEYNTIASLTDNAFFLSIWCMNFVTSYLLRVRQNNIVIKQ